MKKATESWKAPVYFVGALIGVVFGLISAHMYARAVEENNEGVTPRVETGEAFRLGLTAIGLMRQITELGAKNPSD